MAAMAGSGAIVRQGHLRKLKTMRKKYFVLRAECGEGPARLEYYESEKKFRSGVAPRRVLSLKSCYNVMRRLDLKQKHVIALFTRDEQLCVVAENEQELHAWLAAILKLYRSDEASQELLHPIQHVWQVNVQKKGLGASKNIQGLYNLCLTDKTLTLVKIKSHNNVISDLGIPERVEYSLKNIRRCGDSECFFYMEVGRQTATGSGELWMHSDDSNIAQSMHSTIYHAMRNCAKETENEKDHIVVPCKGSLDGGGCGGGGGGAAGSGPQARRGTFPGEGKPRAALYSAEGQANNTLTSQDRGAEGARVSRHHRTESLPGGCPSFPEPLRIVHTRTFSAPLTGDEVDRAIVDKAASDAAARKGQWAGRRASAGARLSKLSPAHTKNAGPPRGRCDSMPSRGTASFESERPPPRHNDLLTGLDSSRDDIDSAEWYGTPRIPEEPDSCDILSRDFISMSARGGSTGGSRTSSLCAEDADCAPDGYLPMAPRHEPSAAALSSSGSVYSGTPSTDPRFSEYQLEPAVSHIAEERSTRAYSVGSRPGPRAEPAGRMRAYSAGARRPPAAASSAPAHAHSHSHAHAHQHAHSHAADHMELDFSANSPSPKVTVARTPPAAGFAEPRCGRVNVDEYVDMSPRNAGYVDMRPGDLPPLAAPAAPAPPTPAPTVPAPAPAPAPATPDGYVEMSYVRAPTRPINIAAPRAPPPAPAPSSPDDNRRRRHPRTPLGSQTIFPLSLDSPASPPEPPPPPAPADEPAAHHAHLSTVRELAEDGKRSPDVFGRSPERSPTGTSPPPAPRAPNVSESPQYVSLLRRGPPPLAAGAGGVGGVGGKQSPDADCAADHQPPAASDARGSPAAGGSLHYAALDLEPRKPPAAPPLSLYTQIDFRRSEQMQADAT